MSDTDPQRDRDRVVQIDDYDVAEFGACAATFGSARFGYVVTPNVDQLIRLHEDTHFEAVYADAAYVLLDSQFLAHWLSLTRGQTLRTCPGSDLTAHILKTRADPTDRIVVVGASLQQIESLSRQFGLTNLVHIAPPMGFIRMSHEVEHCLAAIERASPFRYCFLAVGSPQQELIARLLKLRGQAKGLALCIGASINFLTGAEYRAPGWIRRMGAEWLFRMLQSPCKLAARYLLRGPRIFVLLRHFKFEPRKFRRSLSVPTSTS